MKNPVYVDDASGAQVDEAHWPGDQLPERDIHAVLAHMESELLNLPDYATERFKALVAELKAKL